MTRLIPNRKLIATLVLITFFARAVTPVSAQPQIPCIVVPQLLKKVRPIHEFVSVDVFLPGCPPSADTFHETLTALLTGGPLEIPALTRFGA